MGSKPSNLEKIPINVYDTKIGHSDKYSIFKDGKLFYLIGDSAMTTHVFTGEGLNIKFQLDLLKSAILHMKPSYYKYASGDYNSNTGDRFERTIKYKALLRYLPHKLLNNICSKINLKEVEYLIGYELGSYTLADRVYDLQEKYKNIPDNLIKNELCFILRDKILKYYTYELK